MIGPAKIHKQIMTLTADLVGISLCQDQNYPTMTNSNGGMTEISYSGAEKSSIVLKNIPYATIYEELKRTQAYNLRMIDGALIQIMYRFENNKIVAHRLAFFPSPDLHEYQNNSDIYELDEIYADVIMKNIITLPIRFDFDVSEEVFVEVHHPKSHLTLGQYLNCRIPVSGPITPWAFMDFILRNFYNTAHRLVCREMTKFDDNFQSTITKLESGIMHINAARPA